METIRVIVADDHPVVAHGTAQLLASDPQIEVVGVATSTSELLTMADERRPDVVVADIVFGREPLGLSIPKRLAPLPVVIFTSYDRASYQRLAVEAGAAGYLTKDRPVSELVAAVKLAASGAVVVRRSTMSAIRSPRRPPSERERAIIALAADGYSNSEIAVRCGVSDHTVETHLRRMFLRYDVATRIELVVLAISEGWIVVE